MNRGKKAKMQTDYDLLSRESQDEAGKAKHDFLYGFEHRVIPTLFYANPKHFIEAMDEKAFAEELNKFAEFCHYDMRAAASDFKVEKDKYSSIRLVPVDRLVVTYRDPATTPLCIEQLFLRTREKDAFAMMFCREKTSGKKAFDFLSQYRPDLLTQFESMFSGYEFCSWIPASGGWQHMTFTTNTKADFREFCVSTFDHQMTDKKVPPFVSGYYKLAD